MTPMTMLFRRLMVCGLLAVPVTALAMPELGRIFALAPSGESDGVLAATANGLYLAQPNGKLTLRASREGGFIALAADPNNSKLFYASGKSGGLLRSNDGGQNWQTVSKGGPGSFGLLAVNPKNSKRLYGVSDGLFRSTDGGLTWARMGSAPDKLMSIAASPTRLYAGTEEGLRFSTDEGASWSPASVARIPATMISAEKNGALYTFNWGQGFLIAREPKLSWTPLSNGFGGQAILVYAKSAGSMFAGTHIGRLFTSSDGGRNWRPIATERGPLSAAEKHGEKLFAANCHACHGVNGIGEAPKYGQPDQGLAPALDDTAHAWHHTDEQLQNTILKGSPVPNSRMVGWEGRLKPQDAQDLIAYMKSMWNERALRCQGPKHMDPGCMK
ncbi:MAG: c-type cytochrome [Rhodocyclaceae bacterium]|nr:c-type cytochrome [Rhodocyclaceae bacterium]